MGIDDLYGERSYLRGKISAYEYKIGEIKKIIERTEEEIKDLTEDKTKIQKIIKQIIGNVIPLLNNANSNIINAKDSVSSYYNGYQTAGWKSKLSKTSGLTRDAKTEFNDIKNDGNTVIAEINKEIDKKKKYLEETKKNLIEAKNDLEDAKRDLEDVNEKIANYDDD